ncbi:endo-1,4-beta-xylanase [Methylobacterium durans]|uniref:endo-1,4-beta-xylanase n=1 Tax=Methylobacterium durans TaxID=2202825 RepID=UPI001F28177D|nr:endo-1,4-beta-xylanase [Methylobacterium durans]
MRIPDPSRRAVIAGLAGTIAAPAQAGAGRGSWSADSLHAAAARTGLAYGTAVPVERMQDRAYLAVVARECGILVPNTQTKMLSILTAPGVEDFSETDKVLRLARANGQRLRGHTLVWHDGIPAWAQPLIARASAYQAESFLRRWIGAVAGHCRGRIEAWDVINEVLAQGEIRRADGLRETPWLAALGPDYIDLAFRILHEVDPKAAGTWNEDAVEQSVPWMEARRNLVLRRIEGMRARGVPIHRFGLQSHLASPIPIDERQLRRFLRELGQMGLGIEITELDFDDRAFPADIATRDRMVADYARRYLDVVLDEPAVLNILTWDFYDPATWLNRHPDRRRPDGLPQRALPFDAAYRRKPLWHAMHRAFAAAPDHGAARERLRRV